MVAKAKDCLIFKRFIISDLEEDIKPYLKSVEQKDAHVLFAAIFAKCHFLTTLDKKHLDNEKIKNTFLLKLK